MKHRQLVVAFCAGGGTCISRLNLREKPPPTIPSPLGNTHRYLVLEILIRNFDVNLPQLEPCVVLLPKSGLSRFSLRLLKIPRQQRTRRMWKRGNILSASERRQSVDVPHSFMSTRPPENTVCTCTRCFNIVDEWREIGSVALVK